MKKGTLLLLLFTHLLAFGHSAPEEDRVVKRPIFAARNSTTIEIDTITLTDTSTVLHIGAFFRPNYWIRIDSKTYIQGGGEKFAITGTDGIKLDSEFFMPASGHATFKLIFPAIPRSLKTIDFIESDCDGCFKIYGIDLTGKATFPDFPKGLPKELKEAKNIDKEVLQDPPMEIGKTTINVHILGYKKGMGSRNMTIYANAAFPSGQKEYEAIIDENSGIATFELEQYGLNYIMVSYLRKLYGHGFVAAGDNADIYVDLQEMGRQASPYHKTDSKKPYFYFDGEAELINSASRYQDSKYMLQVHSPEFFDAIAGMSTDDYVNYVMAEYAKTKKNIESASIPDMAKELFIIDLRGSTSEAILRAKSQLETAYRIKNKIPWEQREMDYSATPPTSEHFKNLKQLNLNDPKMLYSNSLGFNPHSIFAQIEDLATITDDKEGFLFDLKKCSYIPQKIGNAEPLTEADMSVLASIKSPFYLEVCTALERDLKVKMDAIKSKTGYTICEIPEVPNEELFAAIAAKYSGKVVFVDFWATWCGPCISSMKSFEPLKESELQHEDIEFVYITGESSPETKWKIMISDVKGDHYRLSAEQWRYVTDEFGITGIPSYAIIQKDGSYKLRNDLRDKDQLKNTLLELANKPAQ